MNQKYNTAEDPHDERTSRRSQGGVFGGGEPYSHEVDWHDMPGTPYKCAYVRYVPPSKSGGKVNTVVRVPYEFYGDVVLCTGYNGKPEDASERINHLPGTEVIISNKFFRNQSLGPLSIRLEINGQIVSDVIGNLGLVDGEHTQFFIVFAKR